MPISLRLAISLIILMKLASAQTPLAITDVTVIDVVHGAARDHQTVLVSNGHIADIDAADSVRIPSQATRIPGQGRFLIPGLWDMHIHLRSDAAKRYVSLVDDNAALLDLFLPNGVVGVREMGGDLAEYVLRWREEIRTGKRTGPRILTAVRKIDQEPPAWPGSLGVKTTEEAREAVRQMKQEGADFIKVYFARVTPPVLGAVIDEAHKLNLRVVGHWPTNIPVQDVVEIGQDGIEHAQSLLVYRRDDFEKFDKEQAARRAAKIPIDPAESAARHLYMLDEKAEEPLYRAMAAKQVWVTPTMAVHTRVRVELGETDFSNDPRQRYVFPAIWESWDPKLGRRKPVTEDRIRELNTATIKRTDEALVLAYKSGVPMLAGTDCGVDNNFMFPGWSLHEELEALVKAGLKPIDALRMATINAAKWRGEDQTEGSVEKGNVADLVLLRSNPLETIGHTREVDGVVQGGKYYSRLDLDLMLRGAEERASAARRHDATEGSLPVSHSARTQ